MKKALNLILVYFLLLIIGIVSATFLYSFYINIMNYVAGNSMTFFVNEDIIKSLFFSTYCMLLFICPVISYYRIRRPGGLPQLFGFIFVSLLTWCVFFPGVCHVENYINREFRKDTEVTHLTKGYFRKIDNNVYYFTKEFESENNNVATSSAVIIDVSEHGKVTHKTVRDIPSMDFNRKAAPFKEVLVKQNFDNSRITLPIDFSNLFSKLQNCLEFKLCYILYFLSFALVMCSIYAVTNFFNWKLINTIFIFFLTVALVSANSVDSGSLFVIIKKSMMQTRPFVFLSEYIYESFLFAFNILCSLIFLAMGTIKVAVRNHAKKEQ